MSTAIWPWAWGWLSSGGRRRRRKRRRRRRRRKRCKNKPKGPGKVGSTRGEGGREGGKEEEEGTIDATIYAKKKPLQGNMAVP